MKNYVSSLKIEEKQENPVLLFLDHDALIRLKTGSISSWISPFWPNFTIPKPDLPEGKIGKCRPFAGEAERRREFGY